MARDAAADLDWPENPQGLEELVAYLSDVGACDGCSRRLPDRMVGLVRAVSPPVVIVLDAGAGHLRRAIDLYERACRADGGALPPDLARLRDALSRPQPTNRVGDNGADDDGRVIAEPLLLTVPEAAARLHMSPVPWSAPCAPASCPSFVTAAPCGCTPPTSPRSWRDSAPRQDHRREAPRERRSSRGPLVGN